MMRALNVLLLGLCVLLGRASCEQAQAQPDAATVLARAVIAEGGWSHADYAPVLFVLQRRAERAGVAIDVMARRYSSAYRVPPTPRLLWVLALDASCAQPAAWPQGLTWPAYEPLCLRAFATVRAFLAGALADPCPRAWHFGGPSLAPDMERAARAGWARVDCGRTAQVYFGRERVLDAQTASAR